MSVSGPVQIRARFGGPPGSPSSLKSAEPAWNDAEQIGYMGAGDNGAGLATSIVPIFGAGAFVTLYSTQTITGAKTFSVSPIVPTPTQDNHAASKAYVDLARQGITAKAPARVATTANITLSATQTIDGVALSVGDRVLVKNQSTASQNGLYLVASGAWTRTDDGNDWNEMVSAVVFVSEGTTQSDTGWQCTINSGGTLGTTAIAWAQFTGGADIQAGNGLSKSGNTFSANISARLQFTTGALDLALSGATAGTYKQVVVDAYGRVTGGSNPTTLAGYGITDAQGINGNLTAFSGLAGVADRLAYFTAAQTLALAALTAFARSLLDDADAATMRTTLGLGALATLAAVGTAQISDNAVSNAKLADVATATLKGRATAGTGDPEDLTAAQAKALLAIGVADVSGISVFARSLLDDADAAAMVTTLGLVIGTNVQAFHANLTALAGLTGAADRLAYFTGAGAMSHTGFSAFARTLVDDADAAAARTTLGLGTMATQAASAVNITGGTIASAVTIQGGVDGGTF